MRKLIVIFIFILLSFHISGCNNTPKTNKVQPKEEVIRKIVGPNRDVAIYYKGRSEIARVIFDKKGEMKELRGNIPDGKVRQYHRDGLYKDKLYMEFTYNKNELNGLTRGFYPDGELWFKTNYKNGKKDGITKNYSPKGALVIQENYRDGKKDGRVIFFYDNDDIGMKNHIEYEKGLKKIVYFYENGIQKGKKKYYKFIHFYKNLTRR